jgi:hypothetical protein
MKRIYILDAENGTPFWGETRRFLDTVRSLFYVRQAAKAGKRGRLRMQGGM